MASLATPATQARSALKALAKLLTQLRRELFSRYHPEKHYMRGSTRKRDKPT